MSGAGGAQVGALRVPGVGGAGVLGVGGSGVAGVGGSDRKGVGGGGRVDLGGGRLIKNMPGVSGFSGLLTLRAEHADVPVVIVSASDDIATISRALGLGASGFVPKSASIDTIRNAIASVMKGDIWKPDGLEPLHEADEEMADLIARLSTLTPQQTRVLSMISQGLLNKQIAWELNVTEATIKAHITEIFRKLSVHSRTQAVLMLSQLDVNTPTVE